ncbi:DUF6492 family protein [Rickettsiaceae bacterium]|nr:DUF6492 family protein [Rickettsiaceae bacterium]
MFRKSISFLVCSIIAATILFMLYNGYAPNLSQHKVQNNDFGYEHDFAIMNKSFKRDLERSVILYKSFEKHFLNFENIPFYIVIPSRDWKLFLDRFRDLKSREEIKMVPGFMTEQEVFQRCGDEDVSDNGGLAQQIVKLCFGSTRIAKNYLMIDSDNYFLKDFDPKVLFKNGIPKTISWKLPESVIEDNKNMNLSSAYEPILRKHDRMSAYDMHMFMKNLFGDKSSEHHGFVISPFLFNSDSLFRMKEFIHKKGGYKISHLIKMIPYEMQWYGEYVLQHEKFIPGRPIFSLIGSPDECHPEIPDEKSYGFWFQSVIYAKDSMTYNPQLIYKRPKHCDVVKD